MSATAAIDLNKRTLHLERLLKATPARVFEALTDPAQIVRWWGPQNVRLTSHRFNTVESGAWQVDMVNEAGEAYCHSGRYLVIDPPSRLALTWAWHQDGVRGHETQVEFTLEATESGTRLTLHQQLFEDETDCQCHIEGWDECLDKLVAYASGDK